MFKVFVPATILALFVVVIMGWLAYQAHTGREQAEAASKEAQAARQLAEQKQHLADREAERVRLLLEQAQQSSRDLTSTAEALAAVKSAAPTGSDVYRQIDEAQRSLQTQAENLAASKQRVTNGSPARIYIHITDESQRTAAEKLRKRLGQLRVGSLPVSAPGVELLKYNGKSELRCFRREECGPEATSLLDDIDNLLETPDVVLNDLSGRYQQSTAIRPWHFELWFGPGPIVLRESSPNALPSPGSGTVTTAPASRPSDTGR